MRSRCALWIAVLAVVCSTAVLAQYEDPNVEGRHLFEEKKYAEAIVKFTEALNYLPNDPSILSWLAACHLNLGHLPQAEDALSRAIAAGGKEYRFFELLAATQFQLKEIDAAIATVHKYREVAPAAEQAQNDAKLRVVESEMHLAKRVECLKKDPPDKACGDAEAEAAWALESKSITHALQFSQIWNYAAGAEQDPVKRDQYLQRTEVATREWLKSATGADALRAKSVLGSVLTRQKRYDEAITVLGEIVAADPSRFSARVDLIRAYLAKEDFVAAKQASSDAIALAPEDPQGYLHRAMAEYGLEDCPAAVKDGAEYVKRAAGKPTPKFLEYCKGVMQWEQAERDRKKHQVEDYKKWLMQQLDYGDEESTDGQAKKPEPSKKPEPPKKS
jgi:tetratricopeptide (TPR) repeat protein